MEGRKGRRQSGTNERIEEEKNKKVMMSVKKGRDKETTKAEGRGEEKMRGKRNGNKRG